MPLRMNVHLALVLLTSLTPSMAAAQSCKGAAIPGGGETITCPDGLTIVVEKAAQFGLEDGGRDGRPGSARLAGQAVRIESPEGQKRAFRVFTPHAIASVRGTRWFVDVQGRMTSVFVQRGSVQVRRPKGGPVLLQPGDGVDVGPGPRALTVKHWPEKRVQALLARFPS